jgi:hypothetical protein
MVNNGNVLVPELFHHTFYFFLSANLNFVLLIDLVHSLREYLENRQISFVLRVKELDVIHWWLLEPLDYLSRLLIDSFERIGHIDPSIEVSLLHRYLDAEK